MQRGAHIYTINYCIFTFLPNSLPFSEEELSHASNPIPLSEFLYLSESEFVANLIAPNKEFLNANISCTP